MKKYYHIRKSIFWVSMLVMILAVILVCFRNELQQMYLEADGQETITYMGVKSNLQKRDECYLCGSNERSIVDCYRGTDTVGVISVNDWYVWGLGPVNANEESEEDYTGTRSGVGNTGLLTYQTDIIKEHAIAEMRISYPDDYRLNLKVIKEHLCQSCLDKILTVLEYNKWKNEDREAIPICLIDFKTMDTYSVQDISQKYILGKCYVRIENDKNQSSILIASFSE